MKKYVCLFLALVLLTCLNAGAVSEEAEIPGTVDIPYAGFRFVPPESFRNLSGVLVMDESDELDNGIWYAAWNYYAMTEEEWAAYTGSYDPDAPAESRIVPLFFILSLGNGMSFEDFNNTYVGGAIPAENIRELGRVEDWTFFLYMEKPNQDFIGVIDPAFREEYTALAGAAEQVAAAFTLSVPTEKPDPYAGLIGQNFVFEAKDLDGNPVSSEELFAQNEVTVVNIWATWCGPCVGELEELQKFHAGLQEKGCGVLGIMIDDDLETARQLISEYGVAYPVILAPDTLYDFVPLEGVPTTLFVTRDGTVAASPVVGAYVSRYVETVASLLGEK